MKDMYIVYCDCLQVITDWPYEKCERWIDQHSFEEVTKFIQENW